MNSMQIMFNDKDYTTVTSLFQSALTTNCTFDKMLVIYGSGGNGKTFLMDALQKAFPSKMAHAPLGIVCAMNGMNNNLRIIWIEAVVEDFKPSFVKETLGQNNNILYVLLSNTKLPIHPEDQAVYHRLEIVECNKCISDALKQSDINKTIDMFRL
jgi:hypothetical protein